VKNAGKSLASPRQTMPARSTFQVSTSSLERSNRQAVALAERPDSSARRTMQASPKRGFGASERGRNGYAGCAADGIVDTLPARDTMNLTPVLTGPNATLRTRSEGVSSRPFGRRLLALGSRRRERLVAIGGRQESRWIQSRRQRRVWPAAVPSSESGGSAPERRTQLVVAGEPGRQAKPFLL
jgi:hypothetical protein